MDTSHWDKKDFLTFLLYYVANTDGELHEDEVLYLEEKLGEERMKEIIHFTESQSDSDHEIIELITDLRKQFYPGEEGKQQLMTEMRKLAAADGEVSQMEKLAMRTIDKLL